MAFLAVDVGGTSTRAVVVAGDGGCLGYGAAGSGNPTASGVEPAAAAIVAAATLAMQRSGVAAAEIPIGVACIAGAGGSPGAGLRAALEAAGLATTFHLEGDLLATFCSGTLSSSGYVLISGTGAVAAWIADGRLDELRDGLGWLLGDRGSGFWIGRRVVRAAMATLDRREPRSLLADLLLAELDLDPAADHWDRGRSHVVREATDRLYRTRPADLARFAPLAFVAADAGDQQAAVIVSDAVDELATTLAGVIVDERGGPFVFGGSVLANRPVMAAGVVERLRTTGIIGEVVTVGDGIVGAAVLALRRGGVTVGGDVHARLGETIAERRSA